LDGKIKGGREGGGRKKTPRVNETVLLTSKQRILCRVRGDRFQLAKVGYFNNLGGSTRDILRGDMVL